MKVSVALFIIAIVLPVLSFAHQGGERPSKSGIFESERNTFSHFIHQQEKDKPANKSKLKGKGQLVLVEKSKYAIDSIGEKMGIPYKAMKLRQSNIDNLFKTKKRKGRLF